ncbi:hypothetical protein V6C03_14015 [Methyloligella sp. 2.7D]|uniref:hypothetical protein n=1 Tax=unclassified Methyloligella TaxID=2625955 RepID=UPI00157C789D|nr:hypothetical protein [Methyloligella sp. GL2]QKP77126.1 hypothetical protein HT051_06450 [Methyloligella sp. GL2]
MIAVFRLLTAAPLKDYRTQVLGAVVFITALANWLVGDMSLTDFLQALPAMAGGLGLTALGAKVNGVKEVNGVEESAAPKTRARKAK